MREAINKALRFRRMHGTRALLRETARRGLQAALARLGPPPLAAHPMVAPLLVSSLMDAPTPARQSHLARPLRLFSAPAAESPRVTVVTDSINPRSLFGGVGTALIVGALLARARGARLRVLTRTEPPSPAALHGVLQPYGIRLERELELRYLPFHDERQEADLLPGELFLTTSWWSTAATQAVVPGEQIVYLLQEDERMFYPLGDEHLRCSQVLASRDVHYVVNSRLLYDHLLAGGFDNIAARGTWFEPAFPPAVFHPRPRPAGSKRMLVFYARPRNERNLFGLGLEVLDAALLRGILDPQAWELVFVGSDIPQVRLAEGTVRPRVVQHLGWSAHAELVGQADLGLSLMYTPHPSYPPLDLAASGAVVVTNSFGNKQDLAGYSRNILCAEPRLEAMLQALAQAVALAQSPARADNHRHNGLATDWQATLAAVLARHAGPR